MWTDTSLYTFCAGYFLSSLVWYLLMLRTPRSQRGKLLYPVTRMTILPLRTILKVKKFVRWIYVTQNLVLLYLCVLTTRPKSKQDLRLTDWSLRIKIWDNNQYQF